MAQRDDAEERRKQKVREAAKLLPHTLTFLRRNYPTEYGTADIAKALGVSNAAVLAELNPMFPRRVYRKAGERHGEVIAYRWKYKLHGSENESDFN